MAPQKPNGSRVPFHSPYAHGFVRVAVATPRVRVADVEYNLDHTVSLARRASERNAALTVFPELGISAYASERDLSFRRRAEVGVSFERE